METRYFHIHSANQSANIKMYLKFYLTKSSYKKLFKQELQKLLVWKKIQLVITIRYTVNLSTIPCGLRHVPAILTQEPNDRRCVGPRTSRRAVKTEIPAPSRKWTLTIQPVTLLTVTPLHGSMYVYAFTSAKHIPPSMEHNNKNSQL
jgi:hypothetical protein